MWTYSVGGILLVLRAKAMSPEERAALRAKHQRIGRWCAGCQEEALPCPTVRLLDDLEAAEKWLKEIDDWTRWQTGAPSEVTVGDVIPSRSGAAQVVEEWRASTAKEEPES